MLGCWMLGVGVLGCWMLGVGCGASGWGVRMLSVEGEVGC